MIAFNLEKSKTSEIIDHFKKYYDLNEASCEELDRNFKEYSKLYETNNHTLYTENDDKQSDKNSINNLVTNKNSSFITENETSIIDNKDFNSMKIEEYKDSLDEVRKNKEQNVIINEDSISKINLITEKIEK